MDRTRILTVDLYSRKLVKMSLGHSYVVPFLTPLHANSALIAAYELLLIETSWNFPNCE